MLFGLVARAVNLAPYFVGAPFADALVPMSVATLFQLQAR